MRAFMSFLFVILVLAAITAYFTLYSVHQTQMAMVLQFGDPKAVITEPGLKFKLPFVQNVIFFDKRVLELDAPPQQLIVRGKKRLVVDAFARYKIVKPLRFFQTVNNLVTARNRLSDILNANLRRILAQSELDDIVREKRRHLTKKILALVDTQATDFGIKVVDVRIKRADLPKKISENVFRRMQAEREREASQYRAEGAQLANTINAKADRTVITIKAEATREGEKIRGTGDAERNKIFAEAFNRDPEFFAFSRSMKAYEKGIAKGARLVLSPDTEFFRYFNDSKGALGKSGKSDR